jgi:hypothetical protein
MWERVDKLPAKHATEDLHRQEEAGLDPALVIGRQAAGGDAVPVRMACLEFGLVCST